MVSGLSVADTYTYDIANRLVDVDGVGYTWDANGNLLSDGVNSYAYTSNKLSSISGENLNVTFQYRCNGLSSDQWGIIGCESDRVSQTVNGVTTNYVLDIASPLTQVLQDGTNTYVYGVDRIAQINGTISEYFLTDGLGSVRQLVDSTGAVTLAKSYEPYGETISSAGSGVSVYQFTGEARDASGLTYLRARYLDTSIGRFMSRDIWGGYYNKPLSQNRWVYVDGNPVNYVDPTGHFRLKCLGFNQRIRTAEEAVPISYTDPLNTYTAAGIAVQCWGSDNPFGDEYSGYGLAQISKKQAEECYGVRIPDPENKNIQRGYGLRLPGDPDYDPNNPQWAATFMRRRIQMVVDKCKDSFCKDRDKFIVAALAQNGPGFTVENMDAIKNNYLIANQIQWDEWYKDRSNASKSEYRKQWRIFYGFAKKLNEAGYYLPPNVLNDEWVLWLKAQ